jgi:hypothetical protein
MFDTYYPILPLSHFYILLSVIGLKGKESIVFMGKTDDFGSYIKEWKKLDELQIANLLPNSSAFTFLYFAICNSSSFFHSFMYDPKSSVFPSIVFMGKTDDFGSYIKEWKKLDELQIAKYKNVKATLSSLPSLLKMQFQRRNP